MDKWKARLRQAAIITVITVVMVFVVGELGLRIVGFESAPRYVYDPRVGWVLRPDLDTIYRDEGLGHVVTSSVGLRDVEHPLAKPENTYRIAILGDSFAEALQLDREKTFWAQLDQNLASCPSRRGRKVEPINFGVSSYGTANELLTLEDRAFAYSPDLVLTMFCMNDLADNHPALDHLRVKTRPYFHLKGDGLEMSPSVPPDLARNTWQALLRVSRVAQLLERVRNRHEVPSAQPKTPAAKGHEAGMSTEVLQVHPPAPWEESWTITERLLDRMHGEVAAKSTRFLLAAIPAAVAVNPDDDARSMFTPGESDPQNIEHRLAAISARHGIDFLALAPEMLARAKETKSCLHGFPNTPACEGHWNERGHAVASELLAKRICAIWSEEKAP